MYEYRFEIKATQPTDEVQLVATEHWLITADIDQRLKLSNETYGSRRIYNYDHHQRR